MNTTTVTRADIEQGTRPELIDYLKSVEAYQGHSRDGLPALRDHALATHDRLRYAEREVPEQPHAPVPDPDTDPAWQPKTDEVYPEATEGPVTRCDGCGQPLTEAHDEAACQAGAKASDDRMERLELAKAEHQALQAWVTGGKDGDRPTTPNLDAMNADYEAGTRTTTRKAGKGAGRTVSPRRAQANARKAAKDRTARKVTEPELRLYIATVMAEHPEAASNDELEYAYWVEGLAVSRGRWNTAWAYVLGAGTEAVTAAKGEDPEPAGD